MLVLRTWGVCCGEGARAHVRLVRRGACLSPLRAETTVQPITMADDKASTAAGSEVDAKSEAKASPAPAPAALKKHDSAFLRQVGGATTATATATSAAGSTLAGKTEEGEDEGGAGGELNLDRSTWSCLRGEGQPPWLGASVGAMAHSCAHHSCGVDARCVAVKEAEDTYNKLIEHHPTSVGKALSSQERYVLARVCACVPALVASCAHCALPLGRLRSDEKKLNHSTLVYGEIRFDSFGIAFEKVRVVPAGRHRRARRSSMVHTVTTTLCMSPDQEQVRRASEARRQVLRHWQRHGQAGTCACSHALECAAAPASDGRRAHAYVPHCRGTHQTFAAALLHDWTSCVGIEVCGRVIHSARYGMALTLVWLCCDGSRSWRACTARRWSSSRFGTRRCTRCVCRPAPVVRQLLTCCSLFVCTGRPGASAGQAKDGHSVLERGRHEAGLVGRRHVVRQLDLLR